MVDHRIGNREQGKLHDAGSFSLLYHHLLRMGSGVDRRFSSFVQSRNAVSYLLLISPLLLLRWKIWDRGELVNKPRYRSYFTYVNPGSRGPGEAILLQSSFWQSSFVTNHCRRGHVSNKMFLQCLPTSNSETFLLFVLYLDVESWK